MICFDGSRSACSVLGRNIDIDKRTYDSEQNRSRNRDFLNFYLVGPHVGPEAELEVSSCQQHD